MKLGLTCIALFLLTNLNAQSIEETLARAVELQESYKETEALSLFEDVLRTDPNNFEALVRGSYLNSIIGNRQKTDALKKAYYDKAVKYANKAVLLNTKSAESHFSLAVALGRMSQLSESEERLKYAKQIKQEGEIAIQLNRNHAGAYHVLGVLNMEIANLAWYKVAAAKMIYDGIPEGCTYEKAARYFSKAMELRPNYILYQLDASRNLEYWEREKEAIELLQKTVTLSAVSPDDPQRLAEAKALLNRLK